MEIGVIGMNEYAQTFCTHWLAKGHTILYADMTLYSKGYAQAESLSPKVVLSLPEKVARQAEVIVLAVPYAKLQCAVDALGPIKQKIVVDLIIEEAPHANSSQSYKSSFERIEHLLPEAKVVKVTPDYPYHLIQLGLAAGDTLYSYSNDHVAQRMVKWFVDGIGYKVIDLQGVSNRKQST